MIENQTSIERFAQYLDDAEDSSAIVLEVGRMPLFNYLVGEVCATQALYGFIRDIWDAGYSHGRQDALAEEGVTLEEIMESGE